MNPNQGIVIVAIVFGTIGAIGFPIARALARRLERRGEDAPPTPADVTQRLDRIERAVEAVALEVERIAEGQRFVTKLMSERPAPASLPPAQR